MPAARAPLLPTFSRRISVETPEHVMLELELAGLGSRMAAAIIDHVVIGALLVLVLVTFLALIIPAVAAGSDTGAGIVIAIFYAVSFGVTWGYFSLFEALGGGRTPGKRRMGIRVVMDTGHPITFSAAMVRNLVRLVDLQPAPFYLIGLLLVFFQRHNRRLGDLVAGTIVVRDRPEDVVLAPPDTDAQEVVDAGPPALTDDEFRLLEQFVARLDDLSSEVRRRFAPQLANQLGERFPHRDPRPETFLTALYADELAKRRAKSAPRGAGETKASGTGMRFVALRQRAWESFRDRATEVERRGLKSLTGEEVTVFAREYRAAAADLARARTYRVDPRVLAYLERIVGMGHNAVYGLRGVRRVPISRLLMRDFPAAAYQARWITLAACLLFILPGIVGYTLVRENPEVVYDFMPDGMIQRAEMGASEQAEGGSYARVPSPYLPVMATSIITNNLQVAFLAFAFGITAGIGTVIVLVFNGLFFGAVVGLFANYGIAEWLLTFVAAHGVLELTAIFIAGAAGLTVARAVIVPGDLARRDALVVYGKDAIRLVGASASLLLLAGTIEGFLSASDAPAPAKLGVSAASAVLLALYYEAGRRATRDHRRHLTSSSPVS